MKTNIKKIFKLAALVIVIILFSIGFVFVKTHLFSSNVCSIYALSFSPDGKTLAAYDDISRQIYIINWNEGTVIHSYEYDDTVREISFSPNGNYYLLSGTLKIGLVDSNSNSLFYQADGNNAVFAPDGEIVYYVSNDEKTKNKIVKLNFAGKTRQDTLRINRKFDQNSYLATTKSSNNKTYLAIKNMREEYVILISDDESPNYEQIEVKGLDYSSITNSENGFIVKEQDKGLMLIDPESLNTKFIGIRYIFAGLSSDGRLTGCLKMVGKQAYISVIKTDTQKELWKVKPGLRQVTSFAFSPNNSFLATGSIHAPYRIGDIRIYEVSTGKLIKKFNPGKLNKVIE